MVSMGQRSNTHETQGHGSHTSNLAMCQQIDISDKREMLFIPALQSLTLHRDINNYYSTMFIILTLSYSES